MMISGPRRTPYEDGLFFFEVQLSPEYPRTPPLFHYIRSATEHTALLQLYYQVSRPGVSSYTGHQHRPIIVLLATSHVFFLGKPYVDLDQN